MKISIRGFLTLRKVMEAQATFDFKSSRLTVNDLLHQLSDQYGDEFGKIIFDPQTHALNRDIRILVNGRHCSHLPAKLNTQLHEGDEVSLFPPIAGG